MSGRVEAVRAVSVVVFGQRYRLELMAEIARSDDGIVCLKDLSDELNVTPSSLQRPLHDLVSAGLLSPLPSGDSKRRYYQRTASTGWQFALELVAKYSDAVDQTVQNLSRPM